MGRRPDDRYSCPPETAARLRSPTPNGARIWSRCTIRAGSHLFGRDVRAHNFGGIMAGHTVKLSLCIVALLLCAAIASTQTMTDMASKTGASQQTSPQASPDRTRTYYIAADDVTWDYVPG